MPEYLELYPNNDMLLQLKGTRSPATGLYLNAATVEVTLIDFSTQLAIAGASWPVALDYVIGSDGDYQATISDSVVITVRQELRAKCVIDDGPDLHAELTLPVVVFERGLQDL